jgi:hypothetical protein
MINLSQLHVVDRRGENYKAMSGNCCIEYQGCVGLRTADPLPLLEESVDGKIST